MDCVKTKLGFGLMRLPYKDGRIDAQELCKMVDEFLKHGYDYFDTAYMYCDGEAEKIVPEVLSSRYPRSAYRFATKLSSPTFETRDDMQKVFQTQLERTGVGYFDNYLLHSIGTPNIDKYEQTGAWDFISQMKSEGLVKHIGFSFHDKPETLDEVLTHHPEAEFVQLQVNYADWNSGNVRSRECCEVARRHNKPIIIMEPVKGGCLAAMSDEIRALLKSKQPDMSIASWAIRFAASVEGAVTVLSGMSDLAQVKDNVSLFDSMKPLSQDELETIDRVNLMLSQTPTVPCTRCKYCVPQCPQSMNIPGIIGVLNLYDTYRNITREKNHYGMVTQNGSKASECLQCGLCEAQCPQKIEIIRQLQRAAQLFE